MSGRPRIVIGTWFYDNQPGFLDFKYRIEALARHYDVTLVLRDASFEKQFACELLTVKVLPTARTGKRPLFGYIRRLAHFVKSEQPDLVFLLGSQLALASWLIARVPVVLYWNEHPSHFFGGQPKTQFLRRLLGLGLVRASYLAAGRCRLVMPIGEAHHEDLLQHGVPRARLELIYMGVSGEFSGQEAERGDRGTGARLQLVYTGTVARERGRDVMLEGLALACRAGVPCQLTLVGADEDQQRYCANRARELGLGDEMLTVVGRVPGAEIPGYLRRADLGICIWEDRLWWRFNPPTKLFEYLVAGLPVLASRIRTHTDYIEDGVNGFVFDYDPASFAQCLETIWARRSDLSTASERAVLSSGKFKWTGIEPRFLELVQEACPG
ncbi:group 1 glycosyl transferase [Methylibium sp. Pch-M]|uniref:glycosyltransferase family 4 protein n=1 Tax=Methylibium sp. Pch-M TaxID=2082386 RepID=UPI0010116A81|nr:glycosyltransferase family 4 protein [Methylibium sp. Pch-M]QAZ38509.1 group 1 glycosyl transferase [Methylibium sp. Pch-M]